MPIVITVAASDPILLAVAPGELALASGDRATTGTSTVDAGITHNVLKLWRALDGQRSAAVAAAA